jgi:predicted ester cyclase
MWIEKNKVIARRFRRDLWSSGDVSLADQLIARDGVIHGRIPFTTDFTSGPEALKQLVSFYHLTFSDIAMTVHEVVAEADLVSVLWSARARYTGNLLGVEPNGREIRTQGIDMLRITEDRIAEGWINWDVLSLLEQIAAPREGGAPNPMTEFMSLVARLQQPRHLV